MRRPRPGRLALALLLLAAACSTVPITGRRQLDLIPASQMLAMSFQQYDEFLQANPPSGDAAGAALVERVGRRIQVAVERYMAQKNLSGQLQGYDWEFHLVDSDEVNAWCMPGGKVVVYSGILPVTRDETGLAVVLGHEIAHAIAKHGDERMSQGMLQELGGMALQAALEQKPQQTQQLWMTAYGVGSTLGAILPYSRLQESEADHLGLVFMAMAGYDPSAAVAFWERMAAQGGAAPPEFLSTHPSSSTRVRQIRETLPEATRIYEQSRGGN